MSMTRTLDGGSTLTLHDADQHGDRLLTIDHPSAPDDMRNIELGRVVSMGGMHGLQVPIFGWGEAALRPEALRAAADMIDEATR